MKLEQLLKVDNIMIIGYACTGKSTIANDISIKSDHEIVHTDDYIDRWSKLIEGLLGRRRVIIEGTDGYRLLRFGYDPDIIIHCSADYDWRTQQRGKIYKAQDAGLYKIWNDYLANSFRGDIPIMHIDFLRDYEKFKQDLQQAKG